MGRFYPHLNDTVMTAKKTLQINLKTIPETGLAVAIDLGPEWFARWHEEDPGLEFAGARITGDVHLSKHGHDILVRGKPLRPAGTGLQPLPGALCRPGGH